jgi:hypothetical protein
VRYIQTAFDKLGRSKPLASLVHDDATNKLDFVHLYMPGTGMQLQDVKQNESYIASLFKDDVIVNDFKSHIEAFDLPLDINYSVYNIPERDAMWPRESTQLKKALARRLAETKQCGAMKWMSLAADAALVYEELERRGVMIGPSIVHPVYDINTFSGRSKTLGFSIQGMGDKQQISAIRQDYNMFICGDWISADMRVVSLLSGDEEMQGTFQDSDPYKYLAKRLGITRDESKRTLFQSIYSLDPNNRLEIYPKLRDWTAELCNQLEHQQYLTSMLGRRFYLDGNERTQRSVFNAAIQGSVAHAMQNVLVQLHERVPECILTELYDSVVLCCSEDMVRDVIKEIKDVMLHPLNNIVGTNPMFPLRVSIGNRWRAWRPFKEFRG